MARARLSAHGWVLFIHQVPAQPSNLRVRIWRKIQQVGAISVKNSVYILPENEANLEIFEWLAQEVRDVGGEAVVFHSRSVSGVADREIISEFQRTRALDYTDIIKDLRKLSRTVDTLAAGGSISGDSAAHIRNRYKTVRSRLEHIRKIDFFESPNRREACQLAENCHTQLSRLSSPRRRFLEQVTHDPETAHDRSQFRNKIWITRPGLHIDRLGSAWLIRRFIDPRPTFRFLKNRNGIPKGTIPFDIAGVPFGHQGEDCSFETLLRRFGLTHRALRAIGEIVHDADLRDEKFGRSEMPGVDALITGMTITVKDDYRLIEKCMGLFDALFEHFNGQKSARRKTSK